MSNLGPIDITRKNGEEEFYYRGSGQGFNLLDFWRWSFSDLIGNVSRGVLAEYIVAKALGIEKDTVRNDWAPWDLTSTSGIRVEVKSASFIQSWYQEKLSKITFSVPRKRAWDRYTNIESKTQSRQADVYVFAILAHKDQDTLDPMDLDQWEFYVLPTWVLDQRERSQHSITLNSLRGIAGHPVDYSHLKSEVESASTRQITV